MLDKKESIQRWHLITMLLVSLAFLAESQSTQPTSFARSSTRVTLEDDDDSSLNRYHECPNSSFNPAIVKGKRFFDSGTGEYIPIKGIAYYPRSNDGPLSITNSVDFFTETYRDLWEVDIQNFVKLGINTLRIYGVDPSQNHDAFMCALQDAGIYVIFGLLADCEDCGILAEEAPACYPPSLKERGQWVINTFSKYRNTLAFSAGNEVAWYAKEAGGDTSWNAPCQKQFIRDMRSYIKTCNAVVNSILPRKVPIGVVVADFDGSLNAKYYGCRTDPIDLLENVEWYGINSYRHCDPKAVSVDDLEGFKLLKDDFLTYGLPIPVVLAEFGCRERFPTIGDFEAQRTWLQVDALFNEDYQEAFAGGVVFEYSAEKRIVDTSDQNKPWPYYEFMKLQYGVGYYEPVDCDHLDISCQYVQYPEFDLLANKMASIDVDFVPSYGDYNAPAFSLPECPVEFPPPSDFTWPTDEEPDMECYVIPTDAPSPAPSGSPSLSPVSSSDPTSETSSNPTTGVLTFFPTSIPSSQPSTRLVETLMPTQATIQATSQAPSQAVVTETPTGVVIDTNRPSGSPSLKTSSAPSPAITTSDPPTDLQVPSEDVSSVPSLAPNASSGVSFRVSSTITVSVAHVLMIMLLTTL